MVYRRLVDWRRRRIEFAAQAADLRFQFRLHGAKALLQHFAIFFSAVHIAAYFTDAQVGTVGAAFGSVFATQIKRIQELRRAGTVVMKTAR